MTKLILAPVLIVATTVSIVAQSTDEHLERALRLEPGFRMALVEYLSSCYQADDMADSLRVLNTYLDHYPNDHEILIAAANLCLAFHVVDEGLSYANRALMQRPGDVEPRVIMARFLILLITASNCRTSSGSMARGNA